jgi:hypothetical protein
VRACSTRRRIASARVKFWSAAHCKTACINGLGRRVLIAGSRPAADRPRPRFFRSTIVDFPIKPEKRTEGKRQLSPILTRTTDGPPWLTLPERVLASARLRDSRIGSIPRILRLAGCLLRWPFAIFSRTPGCLSSTLSSMRDGAGDVYSDTSGYRENRPRLFGLGCVGCSMSPSSRRPRLWQTPSTPLCVRPPSSWLKRRSRLHLVRGLGHEHIRCNGRCGCRVI